MCKFFSIVSDGKGKPYYFDSQIRRKIIAGKLKYDSTDSHTSIADYFGFKGREEDKLNKYEFNSLTREFIVDKLNTSDDSQIIKAFCKELDFQTIVPELVIKPIIHPFQNRKCSKVNKHDIELLKKWASVRDSVWDSVWASVGAYTSSFFNIKYKFDFLPAIKLWEKGLAPSFDGKIWRLHGYPDGKILWEGKILNRKES